MLKNPFTNNSLVNKYQSLINQINTSEDELKTLTDIELRAKSFKLKKQSEADPNLNSLIAESFALTREASKRTLGLRHFDVQLIGGLVLNDQKIAEMKTGEGKTLVATLPAFLNALTKKGVHIVTVNEYLANRDQVSMGQIYIFLGLDTGLIQDGMSTATET
jgi:preprotein translocase subunit SecA